MQTNPAVEQNKKIKWCKSHWNGGNDLPKSQVLSSEWKTEQVTEDWSGDSEDGEDDELLYDFLLVITELFSLGVTAEALRANIGWKSAFLKGWVIWAKISGRRGRPPPTTLCVWKLEWSIFHMCKNLGRRLFRHVRVHAFDKQMEGQDGVRCTLKTD